MTKNTSVLLDLRFWDLQIWIFGQIMAFCGIFVLPEIADFGQSLDHLWITSGSAGSLLDHLWITSGSHLEP